MKELPATATGATTRPAGGSSSTRLAVEQVLAALQGRIQGLVESQLAAVEERLETLSSQLESNGRGGASEAALRDKLKSLMSSLVESGVLERLVDAAVERRLASSGDGTGVADSGEALRKQAGVLVKEFLSENLGKIFQSEIRGVVQKEMQGVLGSENMKVLIDDKFRAVNLYLKTEVIPKTVRQVLKDIQREGG